MIINRASFPQNIDQHSNDGLLGREIYAIVAPSGAIVVADSVKTTFYGVDGMVVSHPTRIEMDPLERGER